jgi:LmbE family N-acetylglucosaminyl deacetylase/predicted ATP-grasp superfamily ATP-dependent carboligase
MTQERGPSAGAAVVVGMSGSTGLATVRALAAHGVACHAVHHDGSTQAMGTRLAQKAVCPDWRREPEATVDFLLRLADRLRQNGEAAGDAAAPAASLFVCDDSVLQAVWEADGRLRAAGLRPAFSFASAPDDLLDKRVQLEAAARAGVTAPWSRWGAAETLGDFAGECPYPVIVKPAFSHLGVSVLGAKALHCASADELRSALVRAEGVDVLLQEYIPGGDDQLFTAGVFRCAEGHLAFLGRKLKQHPPSLGIARLAETAEVPELVPGSVALLRELGYEGISQVEYKRDARDGSFQLIEANYRPWVWSGLATVCGVNLSLAAHRWALWGEVPADDGSAARAAGLSRTRSGGPRRWVWAVPEAKYALRDLRHGVRPGVSDWRGLCAEAFFSRDDPAPFVRGLSGGLGARLRRGVGAYRTVRGALRRALAGPAAAAVAPVLWGEWRRAERRTVLDAPPEIGLPAEVGVLVLAPHPDDETLMCGATIAALRRRGDPVRVLCLTTGTATSVAAASDVGEARVAELRAACAALGVEDVVVLDHPDGGLRAARPALAESIGREIDAFAPRLVVAPFVHDAHGDHVAVALALGDALASRAAASPLPMVLGGVAQTPLSPDWATRLVPVAATWPAKRSALAAYVSRTGPLFTTTTVFTLVHPARLLRRTETFVELSGEAWCRLARAADAEGLVATEVRGGGHALGTALRLVRERARRERISTVLRASLRAHGSSEEEGPADAVPGAERSRRAAGSGGLA